MDTTRKLAQAAGAWLQYEFACDRSRLFNERHLSGPIANVLYSIYKAEVHSEFVHPILKSHRRGPGRPPEVDFAVIEDYPKIKCVVETKWVGKSSLTAQDLIWDILRLELMAHAGAQAFLVLGGRRRELERFFASQAFKGKAKKGKYRRLLKLDSRKNATIRVDNPPKDRVSVFRKILQPYSEVLFSSRAPTSTPYRYPEDCPTFQYQVYAWQILSDPKAPRFYPKNHALYRTAPAKK